ncbi:MAG: HEAT repeat domain-containing protein [Turneriella sp.]|nr:HEAT repeat domain-containing protein [Turneriella sp.]
MPLAAKPVKKTFSKKGAEPTKTERESEESLSQSEVPNSGQSNPKENAAEDAKTNKKEKPASPELLARIRDTLRFGNSLQVRDALNTLGRLSAEEQKGLLPELKQLLKSQDSQVLRKLAEYIGNAPFADLDEELPKLLQNKTHDPLFFAAVSAIAKKKPASALSVLQQEIREQDFSKAGNRIPDLLHLLALYKDSSLQPFLTEKLRSADTYSDYRGGILRYLGEITPWSQEMQDLVLKIFQDESEPLTVRGAAAQALGKARIDGAKPVLKEALNKIENLKNLDEKKRYTRFRMQVIAGLILLQDGEVQDILFNMARDDDEQVRARAIYQIGQLKLASARELLEYKAKYDPSVRVQKEAKKALAALDGTKPATEEESREP